MNCLLAPLIFAAEPSRSDTLFTGLRGGFQGRGVELLDIAMGVAALAGIVAVVWMLAYLLTLRDRNGNYTSPRWLFFSLCRAHRLRWIECWWLWRLARSQRLREPATLFLEPERLQRARLAPALWTQAALFDRLRDRLFVGLVDEETSAPPKPVPLDIANSPAARRGTPPLLPASANPTLDAPPFVPPPDNADGTPDGNWFHDPTWSDRSPVA